MFHHIGSAFGATGFEREHIWQSGEGLFSVLGDANDVFRATSVERERNYTSSRRSDQNSMVISFDERRAGAKPWWGPFEAPSVPIWLVSRNVAWNIFTFHYGPKLIQAFKHDLIRYLELGFIVPLVLSEFMATLKNDFICVLWWRLYRDRCSKVDIHGNQN